MPSPLRSPTRTTDTGSAVGNAYALANRPPPRPIRTPSVFEPGLRVSRSVGPPDVKAIAAAHGPVLAGQGGQRRTIAAGHLRESAPGAKHGGNLAERASPLIVEDFDLPRRLVRDDQIRKIVALKVGNGQPGGTGAHVETFRVRRHETVLDVAQETALAVAHENRKRVVARIPDDEVALAVAEQIGRDNLRRQRAGRQLALKVELTILVQEQRDEIVVRVDAGDLHAQSGGHGGDVARRVAAVDDLRRSITVRARRFGPAGKGCRRTHRRRPHQGSRCRWKLPHDGGVFRGRARPCQRRRIGRFPRSATAPHYSVRRSRPPGRGGRRQ